MELALSNDRSAQERCNSVRDFNSLTTAFLRFLDQSNEFFEQITFITFGLTVVWLCSTFLQLQHVSIHIDLYCHSPINTYVRFAYMSFVSGQSANGEYIMIFQSFVSLIVAFSNLFVYCYFGQKINSKFAEVADASYALLWHQHPLNVQKYTILMLMRSQRPFFFTGYFIYCSLETLKVVSDFSNG